MSVTRQYHVISNKTTYWSGGHRWSANGYLEAVVRPSQEVLGRSSRQSDVAWSLYIEPGYLMLASTWRRRPIVPRSIISLLSCIVSLSVFSPLSSSLPSLLSSLISRIPSSLQIIWFQVTWNATLKLTSLPCATTLILPDTLCSAATSVFARAGSTLICSSVALIDVWICIRRWLMEGEVSKMGARRSICCLFASNISCAIYARTWLWPPSL